MPVKRQVLEQPVVLHSPQRMRIIRIENAAGRDFSFANPLRRGGQ
jgi:hypothetical protein